jgi:hypothetical protein
MPTTIAEVFAAAGIEPERITSVTWGTKPETSSAGVYVIAVTRKLFTCEDMLAKAPLAEAEFQQWLQVCPKLTLDGSRPQSHQLIARLGRFWLPDEVAVYIGLASSLSGRLQGYYTTPIGARRPHSGGYFLKLLSDLDQLWVHYATCTDSSEAEDRMLRRFCNNVAANSRQILHDAAHPFPFANLEWPRGVRKAHGLRHARRTDLTRKSASVNEGAAKNPSQLPIGRLPIFQTERPKIVAANSIEEMARCCYGYGSWDAPYWFIGLEEGMDGSLDNRISAWQEFGKATGLSDCRAFHRKIGVDKWHRTEPKAALQSTWKQLIRVLFASRRQNTGLETIRRYQAQEWGKSNGETCIIELSGLPAKGLKQGVTIRGQYFTADQVEQILMERTAAIQRKILEKRPKFVVMYGVVGKPHFERLAGRSLKRDEIVTVGNTKIVLTQHPVARGSSTAGWESLGHELG